MSKTINGKKVKMSQIFKDDGKVIPVTIIHSENELDEGFIDKDVVVIGRSKGKGFAGVMKKWGFKGGPATRGQSDKPRAAGSIGSQTPGRVYKGKKMAGRMGNERVTIKGLKIVGLSKDEGEILVSGSVPGARNSNLKLMILEE